LKQGGQRPQDFPVGKLTTPEVREKAAVYDFAEPIKLSETAETLDFPVSIG
jgi:hypothetical protein